jgi:chromodomain-helicase-DNA-binding protein 1
LFCSHVTNNKLCLFSEQSLDYLKVDRIIAHRNPDPTPEDPHPQVEYLVKWCRLPHGEATWEPAENIKEFQDKIDQYLIRVSQLTSGQRNFYGQRAARPDFEALPNGTPEFLKGGQLRDYQVQGVNWLVYSWTRHINCILADEMFV